MGIKFSITNEDKNKMLNEFQESIDSVDQGVEQLFEEIQTIYLTQNYEQFYQIALRINEHWNEKVNEEVLFEINNWEESPASIVSFLSSMKAFDSMDDQTRKEAEDLQYSLVEATKGLFRKELEMQAITESVSMTKTAEEILEDIIELVASFKNQIASELENLKSIQRNNEDDNILYTTWGSFVDIVFTALESHVKFIEKQVDHFGEEITSLGKNVSSQARDVGLNLLKQAQESASSITAADLFDI